MPVIRKQVTQHYSGRSAGTPPFKTLKQWQKHADNQKRDRNALFGTVCGYTPLQNYLTKGLFRETPSGTVTEYSFRPSLLQRKSIIQALKQKSRRGGGDLLYEI